MNGTAFCSDLVPYRAESQNPLLPTWNTFPSPSPCIANESGLFKQLPAQYQNNPEQMSQPNAAGVLQSP